MREYVSDKLCAISELNIKDSPSNQSDECNHIEAINNVDYPNFEENLLSYYAKNIQEAMSYARIFCSKDIIVIYDQKNTISIKFLSKSGKSVKNNNKITFINKSSQYKNIFGCWYCICFEILGTGV